ncbi:MAG: Mur ligase domain-containing protein, partial [Oscillospiraceae bacterium]|nr:Mur ligase domain-containing protein [Oscillospiraceae bacterium]
MMTLYDLCSVYPVLRFQGNPQTPIKNLAYDSRQAGPGTLFIALRGQHDDGHHYLEQAAKRGAGAVVISVWPAATVLDLLQQHHCALVLVSDTRDALAYVAARYYEYPSSHLQLIGCVAWLGRHRLAGLLSELLNQLRLPTGFLDGMRQVTSDQIRYIGRNHPEAPEIQAGLAAMLQLRQKAAVLPLRYLDLSWRRQAYANFRVLLLLNARTCLAPLETQALAAAELVLYNEDDPAFTFLRARRESNCPQRLRSFGLSAQADVRGSNLHICKGNGRLGTKLAVSW